MKYVSLFSGIEAATVAFKPLGWSPVGFSEIDGFPSAVLAHRFPEVPNLGDITQIDWDDFKETHGVRSDGSLGLHCSDFPEVLQLDSAVRDA